MKISLKRCLTLLGCSLLFLGQPLAAQDQSPDQAEQAQTKVVRTPPKSNPVLLLSDKPTRAEAEAYVNEVRRQSLENSSISIQDPEIEILSRLPVEHIDLLLREIKSGGVADMVSGLYNFRFHAYQAIGLYDPESYRQMAIEGLSEEPSFIYVIARHGWYQQAKDTILAKLKSIDSKDATFEPIWWQAFLEVAEEEHHPLLHEIALGFYDLGNRLKLLEAMPGYDFAKTVAACWEKAQQPDENGKERTAVVLTFMRNDKVKVTDTLRPYAIRTGQIGAPNPRSNQRAQAAANLGDVDRLGRLINVLYDPKDRERIWFYTTNRIDTWRNYVMQHINAKGSNKEIAEWYKANRADLAFDNFTKRFVIIDDF